MGWLHSVALLLQRLQDTAFLGTFPGQKVSSCLTAVFLYKEIPLPSGKHLYIINSHNSSYDDGNLKAQQMDYLRQFLLEAYDDGNYVVVGAGLESMSTEPSL